MIATIPELISLPVYQWNRCVVVPPRHPLLKDAPLTLEKIAQYPIVTYDFSFANRSLMQKAFDAKRDRTLRAIDAAHLFESSTTRLGVKRGAYLRRYAYEFIELFAPQLPRSIVERAVAGDEGSRYEL